MKHLFKDEDIVSTSREILEKFIRELHELAAHVKILIMPIRGKISNALTTPTKEYFDNKEVAGLFKIFGYNGYQKKFEPEKFKPDKVVIATDADADGCHIRCLLLGLFLRYLPFVIEQGKLYIATPPLYGVKIGKQKKFFNDNIDYIEYVQNTFCKENEIVNVKTKKPYSKKEITKILYRNMYYAETLEKSNVFNMDPYLLEFVLYNRNVGQNKIVSLLKKNYQYVEAYEYNGIPMIKVLSNGVISTIFFTKRLFDNCAEVIEIIESNLEEYYIVNGIKTSIYGLMKLFSSFEPKNIDRYKGLGEMNGEDLAVSTVLPNNGRTLKQYTTEDCKKELKYFTELQSDKSLFIKGIKIRKEDIV